MTVSEMEEVDRKIQKLNVSLTAIINSIADVVASLSDVQKNFKEVVGAFNQINVEEK
jgi:hypothetical protein